MVTEDQPKMPKDRRCLFTISCILANHLHTCAISSAAVLRLPMPLAMRSKRSLNFRWRSNGFTTSSPQRKPRKVPPLPQPRKTRCRPYLHPPAPETHHRHHQLSQEAELAAATAELINIGRLLRDSEQQNVSLARQVCRPPCNVW